MTRAQVADMLGIHPDRVTHWLHEGLGYAVASWERKGRAATFVTALVYRWHDARSCRRDGTRPCFDCRLTLEDCDVIAAHLREAQHGWGECAECLAPYLLNTPRRRH
jgi:hypothetical protein